MIWIVVGQGPTVLTVGAGEAGLDIFSHLSPSFVEMARHLKSRLPQTIQPRRKLYVSAYNKEVNNVIPL